MKLYPHLLSIFFLHFVFTTAFAQGKEDRLNKIFDVKKTFQKINSFKKYKIVTIKDAEKFLGNITDNGGSLKGYFTGDSLKKIVEWVGLSNRIIQNEFYFKNDTLVFVYAVEKNYHYNNHSQTLDYTKLDLTFIGRYYFDNEKLFYSIIKNENRNKSKQKDAADFLIKSKDYMKILRAELR